MIALHHADDAVIVEAMLYGTHEGPYRGLPPTGREFEMRFCAIFDFEEDRLMCERVYFDANTVLRQLGIAHDPLTLKGRVATVLNHPFTVGRAVTRQLTGRWTGRLVPRSLARRRSAPTLRVHVDEEFSVPRSARLEELLASR